ncbi:MAG: PfkB family carbohydrate kinase [Chlamydiota bacterium]
MHHKVKSFAEIQDVLEKWRSQGYKIVQCHGVFDLLHPGHIRHFKEAKNQGDKLVVTVTPDRFVNKGPGRPAFQENLRLESLASLEQIDCVVLNETSDAVYAIEKIKPNVYVKGKEYADASKDVTGKIVAEAEAVEKWGGSIFYTDDIVFSSSSLLNQHFSNMPPKTVEFLQKMKTLYSSEEVLEKIESLSDRTVVVIGDAIIDEYQYVEPLGQSGKGTHMVASHLDKEVFLGGSLIIANHLAQFVKKVYLITALGDDCIHQDFIRSTLYPNVEPCFVYHSKATLAKKRYILKDGNNLSKLFETYTSNTSLLEESQTEQVIQLLQEKEKNAHYVLACDFGNGFTNPQIVDAIGSISSFLALNTQTNGGNRGFNCITNYRKADFISLNEPELRLAAQDRSSRLEGIASDIMGFMNASCLSATKGVHGVFCMENENHFYIPPFVTNSIDRVGAGDSYFALTSLCLSKGFPLLLSGFIGSVAAALNVQVVGNRESIQKTSLCKFITRLLK